MGNGVGSGVSELESRLLKTGAERLALLGKHAERLMQAYTRDDVPLEGLSDGALRKLLAARVLWRPDEQSGVKLSPKVRDLIAEMLADETRRHVNADVAETLELIRTQVDSYREARSKGEHWRQEQQLLRLRQEVDDLNGRFADAIDSLWQRLNSDFGFVSQLNDKIRENDRAQKQIVRLLDGLALIDFDELIELMARFRKQQARSRLMTGMAAFLREHPGFVPGNYAQRSEVPALFNRAAPLNPAAAPALDRPLDTRVLAELLHELPAPRHAAQNVAVANPVQLAEESLAAARQQALKQDVERFYLAVLDQPPAEPVSALAYLQQSGLEWADEIWLFQVIAEYQGLPRSEQQAFRLQQEESKASAFNDLRLIHDVALAVAV